MNASTPYIESQHKIDLARLLLCNQNPALKITFRAQQQPSLAAINETGSMPN